MTDATILERSHWIFDLDGTLTIPKHDFGYIRQVLGVPDDKDILGYLSELPEEKSGPLHDTLNEIELEIAQQTEAAHGVQLLIETLHQRPVQLGILTRNTRHHAAVSLDVIGLGEYFPYETILGRDEAQPKPDPDGIHQLLGYWNAEPEDAVMIGDYLFDLQTGKAAGVATIHVDPEEQYAWPELTDLAVATLEELHIRIGG